MQTQNYANNVKVEAEEVNYGHFYAPWTQFVPEVKVQAFENMVKIQEENFNKMLFYTYEDRVKAEELTDQEEKLKPSETTHKGKPIKTKTIIIQKNKSLNEGLNTKKCKDKRTGKYEQSLAQKFLKRITGYHYCKNFNQFYHKQMTMYIRETNQVSPSEISENLIHGQKQKIQGSMCRIEITQLTEYVLTSLKAYQPYMKKYKQQSIYGLFESEDFKFFETFFKSLFKKVYEIMIKVTYRRSLRQMLKLNRNDIQKKDLSYNGLDEYGEIEIAQAFNFVFQRCILQWKNNSEAGKELLRLKLEKLCQMQ